MPPLDKRTAGEHRGGGAPLPPMGPPWGPILWLGPLGQKPSRASSTGLLAMRLHGGTEIPAEK
ncbi:hypothetical protein ACSSS7_001549 [Eimeria intestinalis]